MARLVKHALDGANQPPCPVIKTTVTVPPSSSGPIENSTEILCPIPHNLTDPWQAMPSRVGTVTRNERWPSLSCQYRL